MENVQTLTPEAIRGFLDGSVEVEFTGSRVERYAWIEATLTEQQYFVLSKRRRGIVRALLSKIAGLSIPQITRLIRCYQQNAEI